MRTAVSLGLLLALSAVPTSVAHEPDPPGWRGLRVLVETLADRFGPVAREAGFEAVRPRVSKAALVPSPLFDDRAVWMTRGDDWRAFDLAGVVSDGVYRMGLRAEAPSPVSRGQYRGRVRLQRLSSGRFEWTVSDHLAIGEARPSDIERAVDTLFRQAERSTDASARAALATALPRASAQFGHLFRVDGLTLRKDATGATSLRLVVRVTPAGLRGIAPRYAEFLEKQAPPIRLSLVVADPAGAPWWTLEAADAVWTLRLRILDGSLVPLDGPANRRRPARLRATGDVFTRFGRFGVGARRVTADLAVTQTADEIGVSAAFLREPDWQLPLLVETVLDSPLEYPFEAPGSEVEWAARETPTGGVLVRRYRARVRETWILRWLGGMANDAVGTFRDGAEREADRYTRACLLALRDDLAALDATP